MHRLPAPRPALYRLILCAAAAGVVAAILAASPLAAARATATKTAAATAWPALPALGLQRAGLTVSGLSSGAYMAGQYQVAYASSVDGAAILAGGPYGCSRGSLQTAMTACACPPSTSAWQSWLRLLGIGACTVPSPPVLAAFSDEALTRNQGQLDDPAALARQRVWLMTGEKDRVVPTPLVQAAADFYRRHGVPEAALHLERVPGGAHGQPTPDGPVACGTTASPFLIHCGHEDAAGALLQWLYAPPGQPALTPATPRAGGLRRFDQRPYRQASGFDGLDDSGWLYVPAACEDGSRRCRLHVAFHGCRQFADFLYIDAQNRPTRYGTTFVEHAGYNRWAETNRIVAALRNQLRSQRKRGLVLGLSGGIDSSTIVNPPAQGRPGRA